MANLSKIKRERMLAFLEKLKKEHTDDESIRAFTEIENQLRDKKYGLVWEEHSEHVDEMLEENIPIFTEDKEKEITAAPGEPYNFILEGDNLQSLYLLEKTHRGKIDVIYIDPPYNRGQNDFVYDDNFIDINDSFRHSKWLSFMAERLSIARELLRNSGCVFISIDANEFAQLKLLCDSIFDESNFIGALIWRKKSGGGQTDDFFVTEHEYIFGYRKSSAFKWLDFTTDANIIDFKYEDNIGKFNISKLEKWGSSAHKEDRPTMYFAIKDPDGNDFYPVAPDGRPGRWRVGKARLIALIENDQIYWRKSAANRWIPYEKVYFKNANGKLLKSRSILYDLAETGTATNTLTNLFGEKDMFENPKPVELIDFILKHTEGNNVLDFFAGSGTTAQAVLESNANDGGHRTFILCTDNEVSEKKQIKYFIEKGYAESVPRKGSKKESEWKEKWSAFKLSEEYHKEIESPEYQSLGICHSVTYPRIKTVITGIRQDGSRYSDGLPANLKYFKCDWTPRKPEDYLLSNALCLHIKEMIELQNGIEVDNIRNVLILNKEDYQNYVMDDSVYSQIENIWVNQNIIFNSREMERLNALGFKYIPKEFFGQELREAAE